MKSKYFRIFSKKRAWQSLIAAAILGCCFALIVMTQRGFQQGDQSSEKVLLPDLMKIHQWKTAQGVPVYFVPIKGIPMLDFALSFPLGTAVGSEGAAALMLAWFNEGFGGLNAASSEAAFDELAVRREQVLTRDQMSFRFRILAQDDLLNQLAAHLTQAFSKPNFKTEDFEKVKTRTMTRIKALKSLPEYWAEDAFYRNLYPNHGYGNNQLGTEVFLERVTPDESLALYKQHIQPQHLIITMVGDIDRKTAQKLAENLTQGLSSLAGKQGEEARPLTPQRPLAKIDKKIDHPSKQAHVWMGSLGRTVHDPDKFAWILGNHILGEGMNSRLFNTIREKHGLVYHISSTSEALQYLSPVLIKFQTEAAQVQRAKDLVLEQWKAWIEEGPTSEELEKAKNYYKGFFALHLANHRNILDLVNTYAFYGLDFDLLKDYERLIDEVTVDKVKSVWSKQIQQTPDVIVQVGG